MLMALTKLGERALGDLSALIASTATESFVAKTRGRLTEDSFGIYCQWVQDSHLPWAPNNFGWYQTVSPEMFELLCPAVDAMLEVLDRHGFLCCQEE